MKAQAAQISVLQAQQVPSTESATPYAPTTLTILVNFVGIDQASQTTYWYPSATEGAVGA